MLPRDPVILLSYVNTKLRDCYANLAVFCEEEDADESALCAALAEIGYQYNSVKNQFM